MPATVQGVHLGPGDHASRPAAATVPDGAEYVCTDHSKIYKTSGGSWIDYFSDTGGSAYTPGGTDVAIADGGTGASTASVARTNLGLAIGTDIPSKAAFDDHSARHEDSGADEISLAGLSGTPQAVTDHLADAADAHDASAVSIADAGAYYTGTDVEAALQEIGAGGIGGGGGGGGSTFAGALVYNSAAEALASGGVSPTFDSEVYDTNAYHSIVSNKSRMTVPAGMAGKYRVAAGGDWSNATGAYLYFSVNGALTPFGRVFSGSTPAHAVELELAAGDYVEAVVDGVGSGNFGHASAARARGWFSITKIDAGGGTSALAYCQVFNSAAQSVTAATETALTFDSEVSDDSGMHSTASNTSRVNILVSGRYRLTGFAPGTSTRLFLWFRKNGAAGTYIPGSYAGDLHSGSEYGDHTTTVVDLVAGDYIEMWAYQDGTANVGGAVDYRYALLTVEQLATTQSISGAGPIVLYGPDALDVAINQGTWTWLSGAWTEGPPPYGGFGWYNSSNAVNDALTWSLYLTPGTYKVRVRYRKSTNTGILTFKVDGVSIGTIDSYAGAAAYGKSDLTGVVIATAGIHTLQLIMASKNGSSSDYYANMFDIAIYRTA